MPQFDPGRESVLASVKVAPPVAALMTEGAGFTLNDWVLVATLVYLAAQIGYLAWRWWRDIIKAGQEARRAAEARQMSPP